MTSTYPLQTSHLMAFSMEHAESDDICERQYATAKREMGAFVRAVGVMFGAAEASRAAQRWLELAESAKAPLIDGYPNWRHITIAAASELAKEQSRARKPAIGREATS